MKMQTYTDDGYKPVDISQVEIEMTTIELIELMYDKKLLSALDVNTLLPSDIVVVG